MKGDKAKKEILSALRKLEVSVNCYSNAHKGDLCRAIEYCGYDEVEWFNLRYYSSKTSFLKDLRGLQ